VISVGKVFGNRFNGLLGWEKWETVETVTVLKGNLSHPVETG